MAMPVTAHPRQGWWCSSFQKQPSCWTLAILWAGPLPPETWNSHLSLCPKHKARRRGNFTNGHGYTYNVLMGICLQQTVSPMVLLSPSPHMPWQAQGWGRPKNGTGPRMGQAQGWDRPKDGASPKPAVIPVAPHSATGRPVCPVQMPADRRTRHWQY